MKSCFGDPDLQSEKKELEDRAQKETEHGRVMRNFSLAFVAIALIVAGALFLAHVSPGGGL